jgi:Autotransporter beta-domain
MAQRRRHSPQGSIWTWNAALFLTVVVWALVFGGASRAIAQIALPPASGPCVLTDAATFTCTGDVSAGVALTNAAPDTFTTLNINSLTQNIAPAANVNGIEFTSDGDITINSDTGAFSILTSGTALAGIYASSTGGNVAVYSSGDITNSGTDANSDGIYAVSATGNVTVTTNGTVSAPNGDDGIHAESNGGGTVSVTTNGPVSGKDDGIHAFASAGGTILVNVTGDVTGGDVGVLAQGTAGGASSTVTLNSGTVYGATNGVQFIGSGTHTLNNYAILSGGTLAVRGAAGDETINNYGTITGNLDLGIGVNAFNNFAGGVFNAGGIVDLSGAGTLTNAGTLSPGGTGTVQVTALTGSLVQTATGTYVVDLDPLGGTTADAIIGVTSASLNGTVEPHSLSLPTGPQTVTIVSAGSVTNLGMTLLASPALHATLLFSATQVRLATDVNFSSVSGLNGNQQALSNSLNQAFLSGGGGVTPVLLGLLNTQGLDAYETALNELTPAVISDAQITALYSSLGFANSLLSCRVNGTTTASINHEGQCLWAGASAVFLDQGTTAQQVGFNQTTGLFAAGAQVALDNLWRLGVGASYQSSYLETGTNATSDGQQGQAGVALKYNPGPWLLAGTVNGGRGWYDSKRPMAFGGFSGTANSDSTIDVFNGGVRLAYVFGAPSLYFKPVLDAAATRLHLGGFTESGGGAANLTVNGQSQTVYTIAPSVEIGTEWWWSNGTLIRPYLRGGATWYENGDLALTASFLNAPVGTSPFTIATGMDNVMGTVGAGLDVITGEDTVLHVAYDGQLGETTQIHSVALKGSARF